MKTLKPASSAPHFEVTDIPQPSNGNGVEYICRRCGACCRWEGVVRADAGEIDAMAAYLRITPQAFTERYTRLAPNRAGLVLTEQPDGACILLAGNACRVHPVKPRQCRAFPQSWNFEGFEKQCRAQRIIGRRPADH